MFIIKDHNVSLLLIGRIATNIADSLFYVTLLWYFKTVLHSPMILSLVFIIGSTLIYPAEEKILPAIINKDKLAKVNGLFQLTYRILDLFLDALAIVIVTCFSLNTAMIISAFVFAIALSFYAKLYLPRNLILSEKNNDYFTGKYLRDLLKGWHVLKIVDINTAIPLTHSCQLVFTLIR